MPRWWTFLCVVGLGPGLLGGCKRPDPAPLAAPPAAAASAPSGAAPAAPGATATPRAAPPAPASDPSRASSVRPAHRSEPLEVCRSEGDPLEAARRYYDREQFAQALSCAAQATAFYPDLPDAHSERGAALSALGRFDEAKLAYARALALDPNHPDALLGAAHLYAVTLPSSRENDELASTYAEHGLERARFLGDDTLISQFALVSAMAFNDLGQSEQAIERANLVLARSPKDPDALYERAVALFELCRFDQAYAAFSQLLDDPERGAHAHHHLGLLLERKGDFEAAARHFEIARRRSPEDFPPPQLLSREEFKREVARAVAELPEDMKRDLVGVPITAEEIPREEDLIGGDPPLSPTILGLFRGPPLGEPCDPEPGEPCRSVALYRLNLARAVQTREELLEQIRVTLLHEVGHLRGEDDHELAARGLE